MGSVTDNALVAGAVWGRRTAGNMGGMCSSEEGPPVMQAVLENDCALVQAEIDKGGDVNEADEVRTCASRCSLFFIEN